MSERTFSGKYLCYLGYCNLLKGAETFEVMLHSVDRGYTRRGGGSQQAAGGDGNSFLAV